MRLIPHPERRSLPASSYDDIHTDLTRLVYRKLLMTTVLAAVGMPGTAAILASHYHDGWLWVLASIMLLLCSGRVTLAIAFAMRRNSTLSLEESNRWQTVYGVVTFLYCCAMATSTVHNFRFYPLVGGPLNILGTFSVCTGLSSRAGMRPWILQACGFALLAPLGLSLLNTPQLMGRVGFVLVCFYTFQYFEAVENQFRIVVEQLRSRRKLRVLSEQDVLTGLANRRHFQDCLADLCHTANPFAVLFIDLDHFKEVNDTYGHATGDALLQKVAERLEAAIRESDLLARLGGDEFAILQNPVMNSYSAQALATRINRDIGLPFDLDGHHITIGASVGIRMSNRSGDDPDGLLSNADKALYQVKQAGGGSFCLAEP